jgi:hypothetical protein
MEERNELQRISGLIVAAMHISTDRVTAAGVAHVPALKLTSAAQAVHLARCIAAFTTDDALADDFAELVGESPRVLVSKVALVTVAPEQSTGENVDLADLEQRVWKLIYAGRRERSRVQQTLTRRSLI